MYIVIGIQAVNAEGAELDHVHSIVVKVGDGSAQFDVEGLLTNLSNIAQEELADLLRSMYSPWTATDAESENRRLNRILQSLSCYLARSTRRTPMKTPTVIPPVAASGITASGSGAQASNSRSTARPPGRASPRVRSRVEGEQPESSRKRRRASTGAGSSGSGMTHVDNQGRGDAEEAPDYEKFTTIQKEFWDTCTSSFVFGMQSFKVDIAQCMIAKDEYIIRKMEAEIVKSVKAELLQMGDINQRQKICLTPVDAQGNLLRTKPKDWNEIKNNKFMIINGQHSIQASKELQLEGCGEERRKALEKWDAIIVWDLDPVRLTKISKFYNMTNHLNHAQPTWGNQIVSGRNIWISLGRPTNKVVEAEARGNGAVQNFQAYMVSSISVGCHLVILDSRITCTSLS
jgi:hypothetical protein